MVVAMNDLKREVETLHLKQRAFDRYGTFDHISNTSLEDTYLHVIC